MATSTRDTYTLEKDTVGRQAVGLLWRRALVLWRAGSNVDHGIRLFVCRTGHPNNPREERRAGPEKDNALGLVRVL